MRRVFILLFVTLLCFCGTTKAQEITPAVKGVSIRGTLSEFSAKLETKGCSIDQHFDEYGGCAMSGMVGGYESIIYIYTVGPDKMVWQVVVKPDKQHYSSRSAALYYYKYKEMIAQKYGKWPCIKSEVGEDVWYAYYEDRSGVWRVGIELTKEFDAEDKAYYEICVRYENRILLELFENELPSDF